MGLSLGQGEWSVRTCALETEPSNKYSGFLVDFLRVVWEKERRPGELQEIFLSILWPVADVERLARPQRRTTRRVV